MRNHLAIVRPTGLALALALFAGGCVSTTSPEDRPRRTVTVSTQIPDLLDASRGAVRGGIHPVHHTLTKPDGTLTRFYSIKAGKAAKLQEAIKITFNVDTVVEAGFLAAPLNKGTTDLMEVSGSPELVEKIHATIEMLEAGLPQIEIEARVVEVTANDDFQLGVLNTIEAIQGFDASGNPVLADKTLFRKNVAQFDTTDFLNSLTSNSPFQGGLLTLDAEHDDQLFSFLIQALIKEGHAELLSAPKITVLNGYTATINIGEETPVFKGRALNSSTVLVDATFKPTGVSLTVTPFVIGRDMVQLVLTPEVSAVTGFTTAGDSTFANPIVSTRKASTTVNIRDRSSFVIGGLLSKTKIEDVAKTPILGDIPLIGALFRTTRIQNTKTQIIFIITPRIIHPGTDSERLIIPPTG